METKIETLWGKLKALPWYWKLLAGVFILLAIVGLYAVSGLQKSEEISNSMLVNHSKKKTDKQVADFRIRERIREKQRQELKQKRTQIKNRVEKRHEEHKEIEQRIDGSDGPDKLLGVLEQLRERNSRRKRRN